MKRILIIFTALITLSCKDNINDSDKRNENWCWWVDSKTGKGEWIPIADETTVNDGDYATFYFNGTVREIGRLKNKEDIDTLKLHDLSGKLIRYKIFLKDTVVNYFIYNGPYKYFYANGNILCEGIITNHARGNRWTQYYENGVIDFTEKYKGEYGTIIWYYDSGLVKDSCSYTNHKLNGLTKSYYPNGSLRFKASYINGKRTGEYLDYYENGNVKQKRNFNFGNRDGLCIKHYENGKLKVEQFYLNDTLNGKETFYYENGNIEKTGLVIKGKFEGEWKEYTVNGILVKVGLFKDDICIEVKNYP